jgi:hypothetical protein
MSERRNRTPIHDPTEATRARLDTSPTIAGLDRLSDRLPDGALIAGRYRIAGLLGVVGMCVV